MKRNYKFTLGYDGSRYSGWEHKDNRDTIQGKLHQVLRRMTEEEVHVIGAGRTDAGVHAKGMVANVFLNVDMMEKEMMNYVNHYLPDDIVVYDVKEVDDRFHARYNATGKTYCYTLYDGNTKPVFDRKYVWALEETLDLKRMREASDYLLGTHDFAAFCKNPQKKKSTVRTVDRIRMTRKDGYVTLEFHGNGFLYNMVRIMTGTIVEVGLSRMQPEQVRQALETKDRQLAGPTAPAQGLCLMEVEYK